MSGTKGKRESLPSGRISKLELKQNSKVEEYIDRDILT